MMSDEQFRQRVWEYYRTHKRPMPWRERHDLYYVLVSEIMLQQTQVSRVIPKFQQFMATFPSVDSLAKAPLAEVLIAWQGLGYNRRARFLHEAAKQLAAGPEPRTISDLIELPGIGKNTAAAICAYVYNEPVAFIETNIRTVYIHEYFKDSDTVDDNAILDIVTRTVDHENPREWYWALMDYGTYLKSQKLGSIRKSKSYVKQSKFAGSLRQARGDILRRLAGGPVALMSIHALDERYPVAIEGLLADGLIERHDDILCLTAHSRAS